MRAVHAEAAVVRAAVRWRWFAARARALTAGWGPYDPRWTALSDAKAGRDDALDDLASLTDALVAARRKLGAAKRAARRAP